MSRLHFIALPLLAVVLMGANGGGGQAARREVAGAARAPYEAVLTRDPDALCADFTPIVAARLVGGAPPGSTCDAAVAEAFAAGAPYEPAAPSHLPPDWAVTQIGVTEIVIRGNRASAALSYGGKARAYISLLKLEGRWVIAAPARLLVVRSCAVRPGPSGCPAEEAHVLFIIGSPLVEGEGPPLVPVPPAVKRAGGEELGDFLRGRQVFAQSGCEACHRIGDLGNSDPGPALTHIGGRLSAGEIEHSLIDPREPMPSFRRLPAAKMRALVKFLALLR